MEQAIEIITCNKNHTTNKEKNIIIINRHDNNYIVI